MPPVASYSAACWPITKTAEQHVDVVEIIMPPWSLSINCFHRITSQAVMQQIGITPITEKVRRQRLRW